MPPGGHPWAPRSAGNVTPGGPGAQNFPYAIGLGLLCRVMPWPRRESSPGARGRAARLRTKRAAQHDRRTGGSPPSPASSADRAQPTADASRAEEASDPERSRISLSQRSITCTWAFQEREQHRRRSPSAPLGCLYWANTLSRATPRGPLTPRSLEQDTHFPGSLIPPACHEWATIRRSPNRLVLVERLARVCPFAQIHRLRVRSRTLARLSWE